MFDNTFLPQCCQAPTSKRIHVFMSFRTGIISPWVGKCWKLSVLILSHNQLEGNGQWQVREQAQGLRAFDNRCEIVFCAEIMSSTLFLISCTLRPDLGGTVACVRSSSCLTIWAARSESTAGHGAGTTSQWT